MRLLLLVLLFSSNITWAGKGLECEGYEILKNKDALNSKMGFQKGDVIKSFDGVAVKTAQKAMEIYKELGSVGTHEFVVERNGKVEKIKFEIAQAYKLVQ